jgi:ElaB/YqjD/DUF883 family membrane-anchored ribosome-binding protein
MDAALSQKLKQDLQTVVADADELLKATASQTGERVDKIRTRAEESLRAARLRLVEASSAVGQRARVAADDVDDQVHRHPYVTAGIAAGAGLLVGLLIARR